MDFENVPQKDFEYRSETGQMLILTSIALTLQYFNNCDILYNYFFTLLNLPLIFIASIYLNPLLEKDLAHFFCYFLIKKKIRSFETRKALVIKGLLKSSSMLLNFI